MRTSKRRRGEVYLLHFSRPIGRAQHYIGFTPRTTEERLEDHRAGKGAAITRAAVKLGAELLVARRWKRKNREFERKLKNRKNARRLCPICRKEDLTST